MSQTKNPSDAWREYWEGIFRTPRAWAHKAERLYHAFNAVASASQEGSMHCDLREQALMLAGMSIEVLWKALLVSQPDYRALLLSTDRLSKADAERKGTFYTHDLLALAQLANVELSEDYRKTARTLSSFIYWRGRYVIPIERRIGDLAPTLQSDGLWRQEHNEVTIEDARSLAEHAISVVKERLYSRAA
jgi:hypothetical protein